MFNSSDKERYRCTYLPNEEFYAVGIGDIEARCMLEAGTPIQTIYKSISKYKTGVNDVVFEESYNINFV